MVLFQKVALYDPATGEPLTLAQLAGDAGVITVPVNETVAVGTGSTELLPASAAINRRALFKNTGTVAVHIHFGGAAALSHFALGPGESWVEDDMPLAVNGIVASGSGAIAIIAKERTA